eukprot:CAMPEP_0171782436 /NCGR_PEP_ID=MMETSP0991-20121206/60852_1 /TAXON_ID=483369 /ORGANISM="non described non described, Strain CCMP2098" /LENGTH=469 /DNA_ID=CAMNT_0012390293 /DNA_START=109 /DNA_END=1518 /DNA_ORIENTATION=-
MNKAPPAANTTVYRTLVARCIAALAFVASLAACGHYPGAIAKKENVVGSNTLLQPDDELNNVASRQLTTPEKKSGKKIPSKRLNTTPVYLFTHVPKSSGENAIGMLVDSTKGEALLRGRLVGCAPGSRSALAQRQLPWDNLKAGKCNFIFAHQKQATSLRKIREAVGPHREVRTMTIVREPVARAISAFNMALTPGMGKSTMRYKTWPCAEFMPKSVCEQGSITAMVSDACKPATKCWAMGGTEQNLCGDGESAEGPLFGELLKFYFSDECQDQDDPKAAQQAIARLSAVDVVGLTEAQDETLCRVLWGWGFHEQFRVKCGPNSTEVFHSKHWGDQHVDGGTTPGEMEIYAAGVADELAIYEHGTRVFVRGVKKMVAESGVSFAVSVEKYSRQWGTASAGQEEKNLTSMLPAIFRTSPAPFPMPTARPLAKGGITAKLTDLNEGLVAGLLTEAEYTALRAAALAKFASS